MSIVEGRPAGGRSGYPMTAAKTEHRGVRQVIPQASSISAMPYTARGLTSNAIRGPARSLAAKAGLLALFPIGNVRASIVCVVALIPEREYSSGGALKCDAIFPIGNSDVAR